MLANDDHVVYKKVFTREPELILLNIPTSDLL